MASGDSGTATHNKLVSTSLTAGRYPLTVCTDRPGTSRASSKSTDQHASEGYSIIVQFTGLINIGNNNLLWLVKWCEDVLFSAGKPDSKILEN